jgi:hypothetical protein
MPRKDEQRILLTQALPGMVLSQSVTLPNKLILCSPGQLLNEQLITRLMNRGIKRVFVQGNPLPAPSRESYEDRIKHLRDRFSRVRSIPLMASLEKLIEREVVRRV